MKYAFLGAGKMAGAIVKGILRSGLCEPGDMVAACPEPRMLESLRAETSIEVEPSNAAAVGMSPAILLCVKPGDVAAALSPVRELLNGKLLISIVAGFTLDRLQSLAPGARVIRAMPNTAALVGRAATAFACGPSATGEDEEVASSIFSGIGKAYPVPEHLLDAVTGLSGSGPAYVCLVIEALSDGGVAAGLPRTLALELAVQTVLGTAEMVASGSGHPALLREMVTSPAGTTMAGLRKLEERGVRGAFLDAVCAATERSGELSRQ